MPFCNFLSILSDMFTEMFFKKINKYHVHVLYIFDKAQQQRVMDFAVTWLIALRYVSVRERKIRRPIFKIMFLCKQISFVLCDSAIICTQHSDTIVFNSQHKLSCVMYFRYDFENSTQIVGMYFKIELYTTCACKTYTS